MLGAVGLLAVALGWIVVRFDGFEAEIGPAHPADRGRSRIPRLDHDRADRLSGGDCGAHGRRDPAAARRDRRGRSDLCRRLLRRAGRLVAASCDRRVRSDPDPASPPADRVRTEDRDRPLRLRLSHFLSRCRLESRRPFRLDRLLAPTRGHALDRLPGRELDQDQARRADRARRDRPRRGRRGGLRGGQRRGTAWRPGRRRPGAECAWPRVRPAARDRCLRRRDDQGAVSNPARGRRGRGAAAGEVGRVVRRRRPCAGARREPGSATELRSAGCDAGRSSRSPSQVSWSSASFSSFARR